MGFRIKATILLFCLIFAIHSQTFHLRRDQNMHDQRMNFGGSSSYGGYSGTRSSGSSSIGSSIALFILSPILFIFSFIMIWNNEKKAAIDHNRMSLANQIVQQVNPFNQDQIYAANGKLVHVVGDSQCNQPVVDDVSGITMRNVIKIQRIVQVKQIRQHGSNENRYYQPSWVTSNNPSPGGGYNNDPGNWFINNKTTIANNVFIGNYLLSQSLKTQLPCKDVYTPTTQDGYNIGGKFNYKVRNQPIVINEYIYFPASPGAIQSVGTLRVRYIYCKTGETSIISQSSGNTFTPFRIDQYENGKSDPSSALDNSCCCCLLCSCAADCFAPITQIDLISQMKQSYQDMIQREHNNIDCKKTGFRILSYILMVLSICAFFSPITSILGYVPFLGGFLSSVVGIAIFIAALIVCLPLFILAMSISWLRFHPKVGLLLLGIGLVIGGIVIAIVIKNKGPQQAQADAQQTTQAVKHLASSLTSLFE